MNGDPVEFFQDAEWLDGKESLWRRRQSSEPTKAHGRAFVEDMEKRNPVVDVGSDKAMGKYKNRTSNPRGGSD